MQESNLSPRLGRDDTRTCLIALNSADRLSRAVLCRLAEDIDDWIHIDIDDAATTARRLGVPENALRHALALRADYRRLADGELERAAQQDCRLICLGDRAYPRVLRDHPLPPPVLYCRGRLPTGPAIAVVGSRKMSRYGREVTELFARHLAAVGVTIVSGFALGVDSVAHRTALSVDRGMTVAVLGCGLDIDYPRGNRDLARDIARDGAVISEFPFGSQPLRWHFPIRNRVIAALATGTLVVQAAERSGSLITAHQALEMGRDVYAVPGALFDPLAAGPNRLIADGALPALAPEDLVTALPLAEQLVLFPSAKLALPGDEGAPAEGGPGRQQDSLRPALDSPTGLNDPPAQAPPTLAPPAKGFAGRVFALIAHHGQTSADELAQRLPADINRVLAALLELELGGHIRRLPGPSYVRAGGC